MKTQQSLNFHHVDDVHDTLMGDGVNLAKAAQQPLERSFSLDAEGLSFHSSPRM
jgi:hypothetical protein